MIIFGTILCVVVLVSMFVVNAIHKHKNKTEGVNRYFIFPNSAFVIAFVVTLVAIGASLFNSMFYYAQPGYQYHVRTITGEEKHITTVGWFPYWFGTVQAWKNSMSITASAHKKAINGSSDNDRKSTGVTADIGPLNVTFLDQVDGQLFATARFKTPTDDEMFFKMVHEYRTPENLMRTALIPAFKETALITAQMMTAEEFFSGGRSTFTAEFENQMFNGTYIVKRVEQEVSVTKRTPASAKAANGHEQSKPIDQETKTITVVEKVLDANGLPVRNKQKFMDFGIQVVEARVMDMVPNKAFRQRMSEKQQASAARAVAKEQRLQEEEKKLLVEAEGARRVAEAQAKEKEKQVVATTQAETEKQLAITQAEKQLEQARIEKLAAKEQYERDVIKAKSIKLLADAEAYKKRVIIQANGALEQKIEAYKYGVDRIADALAKYKAPQNVTVLGGGNANSTLSGAPDAVSSFLQLLTANQAKQLSLSLDVGGNTKGKVGR